MENIQGGVRQQDKWQAWQQALTEVPQTPVLAM